MNEWKEYKLGDIADIIMGQSPPGESCNTNMKGIPLLNGPTEFTSKHPVAVQFTIEPKRLSKKDDILFCVRGSTTGKMNWADKEYAIGRGLAAIRHKKGIKGQHFIKGFIDFNLPIILGGATGSTFPNVSGEELKNLPVLAPDFFEQTAIASVLSSLDNKIDFLHRQNKTLEQLAETIFRQWFVEEAGKRWEILKLAELCSLITDGKHGDCKDEFNSGYYFVSVKDIKNGRIEYDNARQITKNDFEETHRRTNFAAGDILITNSGTIGRMAIARDVPETRRTTFQKSVAILKPKHKIVTSSYLYCLLKSHLLSIIELAGGTTQSNLLLGDIRDFEIKYPGYHAVCEFENKTNPLFKKVFSNDSQIKTLTQLRDNLLPKLLNGEVRVSTD